MDVPDYALSVDEDQGGKTLYPIAITNRTFRIEPDRERELLLVNEVLHRLSVFPGVDRDKR